MGHKTKKTNYIPKDQVKALSRRSDFMGFLLVLHCWAMIIAAGALFVIWPNPLTFIAAMLIIGGRQLGMAILMHDCAHGILFKTPALNKIVGQYTLAYPIGIDLPAYRSYHLKHHKYTQGQDDPDLPLSAPFPISRKSLWRKILRDLSGLTGLKLRLGQIVMTFKRHRGSSDDVSEAFNVKNIIGPYLVNLIMFGFCYAAGLWWAYFVLWLLPLLTTFQLTVRIRNIAEHALTSEGDPLRQARTTFANPLERLLVAPYWVNYHVEHHVYMYVPCWQLRGLHKAMDAAGHVDNMETKTSYIDVLRHAAPIG